MSHVVEFVVKGLVGREETIEYQLNRNVNILFGLNGSGKTSLLKILHSAMSGDARKIKNVPFSSAEVKVYSKKFDQIFTHKINKDIDGFIIDSKDDNYKFQDEFIITDHSKQLAENVIGWEIQPATVFREENEDIVAWRHRFLPTSRIYNFPVRRRYVRETEENEDDTLTNEEIENRFAEYVNDLWFHYASEINQKVRMAQEEGLTNILKEILSGKQNEVKASEFEIDKAYKRVRSFLDRRNSLNILASKEVFEEKFESDYKLRSIVEDIDKVEKKIEEVTSLKKKFQDLINKLFTGNKKLLLEDYDIGIELQGRQNIGLQRLSSGEKHLVRLFLEAIIIESSSLLIDEPEMSMHIDWQRDLIENFRLLNPHSQLILATHSPEIMAKYSEDKIFNL